MSIRTAAPKHDRYVCGLDAPGISPTCPACIIEDRARSAVGAELARIGDLYRDADRRANAAGVAVAFGEGTAEARAAADMQRLDIEGEYLAAGDALADLLLILLRYAVERRPDALHGYLADALQPDLQPLADSIVRLEGRRS